MKIIKAYIKGVPERGKEVIAKLESLGGKNVHNISGNLENTLYYINDSGEIDWINTWYANAISKNEYQEIKLDDEFDETALLLQDSYKPVWNEELQGVYIPNLNVVIDNKDYIEDAYEITIDWRNAIATAESIGKSLLSLKEWQVVGLWKNVINDILKEHDCEPLEGIYWTSSSSECNRVKGSWYINIDSGKIAETNRDYALYVRFATRVSPEFINSGKIESDTDKPNFKELYKPVWDEAHESILKRKNNMKKFFIKGNPLKGNKVIAKLRSLGGRTVSNNCYGDHPYAFYFIGLNDEIQMVTDKVEKFIIANICEEVFIDE